ncbi:hypothetical protein SAMN05660209_04705, partial [Geodermatophilus africanus]
MPEQDDQGFVERVGGAEDGVHQGGPDTPLLMTLPHAEWTQAEDRLLAWQQPRACAADVARD